MYDMSAFDTDPALAAAALKDSSACIYIGHFPFGLHEWLSRPSCYMAVVRKPLDRILSLYYYTIQFRETLRQHSKESGQSITDLFRTGNIADMYEEFIPWIEGEQTLANFLDCHSSELDNGMVRRFSGIGLHTNPCPSEALDLAKENIEKYFSVVGVQERYEDTIRLLRMTFSWAWLTEYRVNTGSEKEQKKRKGYKLTANMKRRIKEVNRLDTDLYEWVVRRFEKHLEAPAAAIVVPGNGRTDYEKVNLWRSIGSSPIRKAAMENSPGNRRFSPSAVTQRSVT